MKPLSRSRIAMRSAFDALARPDDAAASATVVERVTVRWSWGETQQWERLEPNRYWELHEGETTPRRAAGTGGEASGK